MIHWDQKSISAIKERSSDLSTKERKEKRIKSSENLCVCNFNFNNDLTQPKSSTKVPQTFPGDHPITLTDLGSVEGVPALPRLDSAI